MERIYVKVLVEVYEGQYTPHEVIVEDQKIPIKKILAAQPIKSRKDYTSEKCLF